MNTNKLLSIAKAMGLDASPTIENQYGVILKNPTSQITEFNPKKYDSQFRQVLEWLLTLGNFVAFNKLFTTLEMFDTKKIFYAHESNLANNILSIAYQVSEVLNNE